MSLTFTISPSRCVECMACVRVCPVEAVRVQEGTVQIVEETCIECGLCEPACQHDAIDATGDIDLGRRFLNEGSAALMLATEAFVHFHPTTPEQLINACYAAGFRDVYLSTLGDELVAREYLRLWQRSDGQTMIRSTSPVVVEFVQGEHPELLPYLAPIVTPAVAQARYLRSLHGGMLRIVYCGVTSPGTTDEVQDAIDAALTFDELEQLLAEREAVPPDQPIYLAQKTPERRRHLSTAGGMPLPVLAAERTTSRRFRKVRGLPEVPALADAVQREDGRGLGFIDLLPYEGELDHPAMGPKETLYWRREVAEEAELPRAPMPVVDERVPVNLYIERAPAEAGRPITRSEIDELIDAEIGRAPSGAYWDCGGCGHPGCVDFARAVLRGRARLDICPFYQARRYEQALRDAAHDALTELYSYRVLKSRLHEEIARVDRTGAPAAILFIDIDEFKPINDRLGHPVGNQVLKDVADAIRRSIRESDFAARFGGDEFVIILTEADRYGAMRVAEEIRWRASQVRALGAAGEMPVAVSIGIAEIEPGDGRPPKADEVLASADTALLAAKRGGGDSIRLYAAPGGTRIERPTTPSEMDRRERTEMTEPQRQRTNTDEEPAWLRRAEELLRGLTGVVSTRIVADPAGRVEEIHVLTDHTVEPKQTVRNVESALLAELGMRIDHRKVSVAQARHPEDVTILDLGTEEEEATPTGDGAGRRYQFLGYEFERRYVHRVECRVRIRLDDEEFEGAAEGADIENARLTVAAQAVLNALEEAEAHEVAFALDGVRQVELFDQPVVTLGVYGLSGRSRTFLAGAVPVRESAEHAAILAALQATNRWIATRGA